MKQKMRLHKLHVFQVVCDDDLSHFKCPRQHETHDCTTLLASLDDRGSLSGIRDRGKVYWAAIKQRMCRYCCDSPLISLDLFTENS